MHNLYETTSCVRHISSMQNVCKTTFEVHDQAKFGFLLCKIFRGSWSTIFAETKNIQILKCNDLHFPCNLHACIGGRRTSWQLPSSLNNQHCRGGHYIWHKRLFSPLLRWWKVASCHASRGDTRDSCDRSHDCHVSAVTTAERRRAGHRWGEIRLIGKYGQALSLDCIAIVVPVLS